MTELELVTLIGSSGRSYDFMAHPIGTTLAAVGVVYAVLREGSNRGIGERRSLISHQTFPDRSRWPVLYIGQTNDLNARFENAHLDQELTRIRATHIAVLGAASEAQRRLIEFDLVHHYVPLLTQSIPFNRHCLVESLSIAQRSA